MLFPRLTAPGRPRPWLPALVALLLAAPSTAAAAGPALVPAPQDDPSLDPNNPDLDPGQRLQAVLAREARIGFTPSSGRAALQVLEDSSASNLRAQALITLGILGSVSSRPLLEAAAQEGSVPERCAAVLGLGELGGRVAGADLVLMRLLSDPNLEVAECALFALLRTRPAVGRARAESYAQNPAHPLNPIAPVLLAWEDGQPSIGAGPALRRLTLRWEAARSFGTVDGLSWAMQQVERLAANEYLLDTIVLVGAAEIRSGVVKDYLLQLLLKPEPQPVVVRGAVLAMAQELDELVATGLWAPRSPEEWEALVDQAETSGLFSRLPSALERAAQVDSLLARVAPFLARTDERFYDAVDGLLASRDASRRSAVAFAIGEARLVRYLPRLQGLMEDKNVVVRAAARLARGRLGDLDVLSELFSLFVDERDSSRSNAREREFLLESMYKTRRSSTTQALVDNLSDSLRDATGQGERMERAALLAIRRLGGHTVDARKLLEFYGDPNYPRNHQVWLTEALGEVPDATVLKRLEAAFPSDGGWRANVPLVQALLASGSEAVVPLLHSAVWHAPLERSILASALVEKHYGLTRLMHWIEKPPPGATASDLRRVGYAVGSLGRLAALEELQRQLGAVAGADRPALQGALLGALASRTR